MTDIAIERGDRRLVASVIGPADGAPVVLLHGLSHARDTWEEVALHLAKRHRVWTLDFSGHGESSRAERYGMLDFVDDARALLAVVGEPVVLAGHSIGACVAGIFAQEGHPLVRAALLEEPPWFLGEPDAWASTPFPKMFATVAALQAKWQAARAPLSTYVDFLKKVPFPSGGVSSEHLSPRHLLSHASALQRQDGHAWRDAGPVDVGLPQIDTSRPFQRRVKVVAGEARFGSAFRDGDAERLAAANPLGGVEVARYEACGHDVHRTRAVEARFAEDLAAFTEAALRG
jgi:pimeloyl-ACP methyl ester carboxylesterase